MLLTAAAVLAVTLSPFTLVLGPTAWFTALWLDVALTGLAAVMVWTRRGVGCLEIFVPFVATLAVVASTAARPGEVGPWIPAGQALAVVLVVVGMRVRQGAPRAGTE